MRGWDRQLSSVVSATFDVISILTVVGIGYAFARELKVDRISGGVVALVSFLILTQTSYPNMLMKPVKHSEASHLEFLVHKESS
ncbi:hypothetical protein MGH68_11680 [Erysipelothrix sp. D19-032]